jgi:hypothetical protein
MKRKAPVNFLMEGKIDSPWMGALRLGVGRAALTPAGPR